MGKTRMVLVAPPTIKRRRQWVVTAASVECVYFNYKIDRVYFKLVLKSAGNAFKPYLHTSFKPYLHTSFKPYLHTSLKPYLHTSLKPYLHTSLKPYLHESFNDD
ncbi:hypothetical protein AVEN_204192-1 [Araneus ventricosus]|uniref:Uncharacterized protein n=1 Tax=Araneus ventricosus TaxID=182803 RepID=A0A4Y2SFX7_ARAVE|nr:hypothetical protein AVEN_204192-1 [Araneus ventricosus]